MAGTITHEWNGTVLTVTSDSGTSSADLQGKQGKQGIRGPQGRAGVILSEDGSVDMTGYATEAYVIGAIEVALEDYTPSGGGGGGGGGGGEFNNAIMTIKNTTGWTFKTISDDTPCVLTGTWSSIEDEMETGSGTLAVVVNSITKMSKNVPQGNFSIDVSKYLGSGNNTVRIKITDIYGNNRSIAFTVNKLTLSITSTFDDSVPYNSAIPFTYTPYGSVVKTVYFKMNGIEIGKQEVPTSGRQQTFTIPDQTHGSYLFEVYFTAEIDGTPVPSNVLTYDIMFLDDGSNAPIISCRQKEVNMSQYETINIEYSVYTPNTLYSTVQLMVEDDVVNTLSIGRTKQTWAYRADEHGDFTLTIKCGAIEKKIKLHVAESDIDVDATEDSLELYLTSYGRSNQAFNYDEWKYGDISCSFSNYNWVSDGWQLDDDGFTVHRVTGDARLTIPLKMFASDCRTSGKTIEFEFSTKDVRDYDTTIVSCFNNNIGFKMTAQKALLKSEQSEVYTQYKEDEHIRVSFVVEKKALNRLVLIYLNGIMCGAVQYPENDNFQQGSPVNITIGSNDCTIDLYNIRVYNNDLTRFQIIDNWIADTQDISLKIERYSKNHIYDSYGNIVIENLPADLPYVVLNGETLPQYKGNKLTIDGSFTNPLQPSKSFQFTDAQIDVQGTSSAGYARKNYLLTLENGLKEGGQQKEKYQMREDSIPTDIFCFKADVASSEGANNVELVRLYNSISPYRTPYQSRDPRVRQGIDGFPMVVFHNDGTVTEFIGKYNFNNDKATPEVYGLTTGDESWEIKNNTSDRVIWKNADFSGDDWKNDFEARYPKDNTNITNLKNFAEWVVSTDREQATNLPLATTITLEGKTYTHDTSEYRLAKFKNEVGNYAEINSALFYYLFTELFLMVDSRAKNAFPSLVGTRKICWLPYDMDTAIGINNEGALVFGYELEDIDTTSTGADVYNGQHSVFWCNIRDCFGEELKSMYQTLRSNNKLSYEIVEREFEKHQSVWPEAVWNEDAYYKYLEPLIEDGSGIYLPMLQGSKSEQRKWWLYNRFRYLDSKYNAGDAQKDFITLRGYEKDDITVIPYADIYASIKYGSYIVQERALRGASYTLECPLDVLNDTEIYIYSASQLKSVGDISGLHVGLADFSMATKLQHLKIGDSSSSYDNGNLYSLTLGNNKLLKTLDVRNCSNFGNGEQQSLDLGGCSNIEEVYLTGTAIKGVTLPNGGILKTLHLPDTITNLTICNQPSLNNFVLNDVSNITTLRLENMESVIPAQTIVEQMADGGRVRIIGTTVTFVGAVTANRFFNKLDTMHGLDENGNNVDVAQISGVFKVSSDCSPYIDDWKERYPDITFEMSTPTLETATWAQIDDMAKNGLLSQFCSIGDEKEIILTNGEKITAVILDFGKDTLSDKSGLANITFGIKNCVATTNSATVDWEGWAYSPLRTTILSYFDLLPSDLKSVIKTVQKEYVCYYYSSSPVTSYTRRISTCNDTLFALAQHEIMGVRLPTGGGIDGYSWSTADVSVLQYEYFKRAPIPEGATPAITGATTGTYLLNGVYYNAYGIKEIGDNSGMPIAYKTRSINYKTGSASYASKPSCLPFYILTDGSSNNKNITTNGITFAFCI